MGIDGRDVDQPPYLQPIVIEVPRPSLTQDLVAHDGWSRQQTQKTNLCESAETQVSVFRERCKPVLSALEVDVLGIRHGDPDIEIREKE